MTTNPERAVNTSGTESVDDEDDNKILRSTDVLAALRDGISAPGLEVLQQLHSRLVNSTSYVFV